MNVETIKNKLKECSDLSEDLAVEKLKTYDSEEDSEDNLSDLSLIVDYKYKVQDAIELAGMYLEKMDQV